MDPGTTNINASSGDFFYEIVAFIGDSPSFHVIGERHDNEYC